MNYTYSSITLSIENIMKEIISSVLKEPEKKKEFEREFVAAFRLWFEITRDDPAQEKDGPRFMDMILNFSEDEAEDEENKPCNSEVDSCS